MGYLAYRIGLNHRLHLVLPKTKTRKSSRHRRPRIKTPIMSSKNDTMSRIHRIKLIFLFHCQLSITNSLTNQLFFIHFAIPSFSYSVIQLFRNSVIHSFLFFPLYLCIFAFKHLSITFSFFTFHSSLFTFLPTFRKVLNSRKIKDAINDCINEVEDGLRVVIKSRRCRTNDGTCFSDGFHVIDMNQV